MTDRPLAVVVLAAGQGKRMKAQCPKVLVEVCGRALVEYVLEALRPLRARPRVVVYGHGGDAVRQALAGRDLEFAHQPERRGTGHAVQCALPALEGFCGDVLVLYGDTPLLTTEVLEGLVADHRAAGRAGTVLSAVLDEPGSLGRMLRDDRGRLVDIREVADATEEQLAVREINTGVMVIRSEHLAGALGRLTTGNVQGEYYLTDVPAMLLADGLDVDACVARDPGAAHGVNDPEELAAAARLLRERHLARAMRNGVRVEDPATTVIDAGVEIGAGTVLLPFTSLGRAVRIGERCRIGPHAEVREGSVVGNGAALGAHVEITGSTLGEDADVAGPARLKGTVVGRRAWIGPDVTTSGEGRVVIGDEAEIGAGVLLVAPVTVGERSRVEPGIVLRQGEHDA